MLVIPDLRKLRQKDPKFKVSLASMATCCFKNPTKQKRQISYVFFHICKLEEKVTKAKEEKKGDEWAPRRAIVNNIQ